MARQTSRPTRSPRARGPMGWLAPSFMAVSMPSAEATPVYSRSAASLIMGIRILLTTNPGASATSTGSLPISLDRLKMKSKVS